MKYSYLILIVSLVLIFSVSLVSASFQAGNKSIEIVKEYGGGEFLKGWINISLQNEPAESQLSCFNSNISIISLLENSGSYFECFPEDCQDYYSYVSGSANSLKGFPLNRLESRIIGLNFQGTLKDNPIQSISFKVESDAGTGCFQPLKIDILNDNEAEWMSFSSLDDFSCSVSQGCFSSSESLTEYNIGTTPYCEKISVPYQPKFKVGTNIIKGTTSGAVFKMQVYNTDLGKLSECSLNVSSSGESSCIVSLNLKSSADVFVCVKADKPTDYKIKGESVSPCGFYGLDYTEFVADYDIFARGSKFAPVGSFAINETEFQKYNDGTLKEFLNNYLYEKFSYNCLNGCVVPIKFSSGIDQTITVSNLQLNYDTTSGLKNENNFYDVKEETAKINMNFTKLDLKYANLYVPSSDGNYTARIYLGGNFVGEERIKVFASVNITGINSQNIPAAVPYKLIVYTVGKNITSYKWEFGDSTVEQTTKNEVTHTYSAIGEYTLKIEVTDNSGRKTIKSFLINVNSPKEFINIFLETKRKNLNETLKDLSSITAWYKGEIEKEANLDEIKSQLDSLEAKYKSASTDAEYVRIMSNLTAIKVPYSLGNDISKGDFIINKKYINPAYLTDLGLKVDNPDAYKDSIMMWVDENVGMYFDNRVYYLYYPDEQALLLTSFVLKIKPKQDFSKETFLIIDKRYDEIKFKQDYKAKAIGDATAITFSELKKDEEKIIEFVLPEKIEIFEFPAYISPEFSELVPPENETLSPCNNNGICEKELDENSKNCPNDCKPWGKALIYWIILLFIAFAVYIALQEWYKRYYEKYLFKNKNDLFNLINFISNAIHQKLSKDDVFKKLGPYGWKNEQIAYAFKKVQGKRTGMWEIPVFRWLEKRRIREEIEKRQRIGLTGIQYPPKAQ